MKRICFLVDSIFTVGGVQRVTAVIAKQLAKDFDVSVVTFDRQEEADVSLYGLGDSAIHFRFFSYPRVEGWKRIVCKVYGGLYVKSRSQSLWLSNLYARSSFPQPMRKALAQELKQGNYDVIVGVHAPLAARLATLRPYLAGVKLVGWIHNSFEALFGAASAYIGPERKRHYVYQFSKLDGTEESFRGGLLFCVGPQGVLHRLARRFAPTRKVATQCFNPSKPLRHTTKQRRL